MIGEVAVKEKPALKELYCRILGLALAARKRGSGEVKVASV